MIRLLGNRVLIEPVEEETAHGFLIPEEYRSFRIGIVAAVGNGARLKNGQRKPIPLEIGARVVLSDDYRMPIELDHKQYFLVSDEKVLCVLNCDEITPDHSIHSKTGIIGQENLRPAGYAWGGSQIPRGK